MAVQGFSRVQGDKVQKSHKGKQTVNVQQKGLLYQREIPEKKRNKPIP